MRWRKLINWPEEELWRGSVFRLLKSDWPHEAPVDLMLVSSESSPSGFALVVTTGYKAGAASWSLPASAKAKGRVQAISRSWLIKNWQRRVYGACPVTDVRIIVNYPPGVGIGRGA
ncbi:immunity 45 family protein [Xanthomonas campestris pv. phormiicola]|nr:immunity 45 family protein [Xanthomonas campestris pv. phormiicola]